MTQLMQTRAVMRWVLITAAVLAVPLLAMVLKLGVPDPGAGPKTACTGDRWTSPSSASSSWAPDSCSSSRARAPGPAHTGRPSASPSLAGLMLVWVNLAVGMIGDEGNPANLMYVLVLAVALIGTSVARFEPREASIVMFATAGAQGLVAVIALVAGLGSDAAGGRFFIAAWIASGLLFRRATSIEPST